MRTLLRFTLSAEGIHAFPYRAKRCREGWLVSTLRPGGNYIVLFDDLETPVSYNKAYLEIIAPPLTGPDK